MATHSQASTGVLGGNRCSRNNGSNSEVTPTKCIEDTQAVKTLTRTALKQKLAALGEVPPVHSSALAKQHQPAPASQELIERFCALVKDAGFTACSVYHAKKAATTLVETARAASGQQAPGIKDLIQRESFTQAVQTLSAAMLKSPISAR